MKPSTYFEIEQYKTCFVISRPLTKKNQTYGIEGAQLEIPTQSVNMSLFCAVLGILLMQQAFGQTNSRQCKTIEDKPCVFPFKFRDKTFFGCTIFSGKVVFLLRKLLFSISNYLCLIFRP